MSEVIETVKEYGYGVPEGGKWPCPGTICSHPNCIIEVESHYVNKEYFIGIYRRH